MQLSLANGPYRRGRRGPSDTISIRFDSLLLSYKLRFVFHSKGAIVSGVIFPVHCVKSSAVGHWTFGHANMPPPTSRCYMISGCMQPTMARDPDQIANPPSGNPFYDVTSSMSSPLDKLTQ
ncbi:hypothetical protein EVAR_13056_1 [Eumeta japonica]|uniref:Uncharacterized protein n=1 Tax=Eumeta variegata TaxID=151549 RepID=A0A4C1VGH6_EUMVA|nr:hypothetical protein EVAR_13056_1 [Eumeta japonica]